MHNELNKEKIPKMNRVYMYVIVFIKLSPY